MSYNIPAEAHSIRLCKVNSREELILCEVVTFVDGQPAVDTALRRAAISGNVGPVGDTGNFWADLMDEEGYTIVETIALDRGSWNALKRRWAKCKIEAPLRKRMAALGISNYD